MKEILNTGSELLVLVIGIRPPAGSDDSTLAKRHPRLVHDEMEAIFGVPSSLNTIKRGYSAGVNTHSAPEVEPGARMGSRRLWLGIVAMVALMVIGTSFIAWVMFRAPVPHPAEFASSARGSAQLPIPDKPVPAARQIAVAAPHCAGRLDPAGNCLIAPPPPIAVALSSAPAVAGPKAAAPAESAAASTDVKPPVEATDPRCEGTGYQHMATCPSTVVLKADSTLSTAYASAIAANVDPARLAQYSQRWSELRETASANPAPTADEFANMTNELDALTVAAASRKK